MAAGAKITVAVTGNTAGLQRELSKASTAVKEFGAKTRTSTTAARGFNTSLKALTQSLQRYSKAAGPANVITSKLTANLGALERASVTLSTAQERLAANTTALSTGMGAVSASAQEAVIVSEKLNSSTKKTTAAEREAAAAKRASATAAKEAAAAKSAADREVEKSAREAAAVEKQAARESIAAQKAVIAAAKEAAIAAEAPRKRLMAISAGAGTTRRKLSTISQELSPVALATGAVAGAGIYVAVEFQKQMTLLETAAEEPAKRVKQISAGVLQLASDTGTSLKQLGAGAYTISKSFGTKSAVDQLKILKAAAEGAKAENVDLGTQTQALTSVMQSYGLGADKAVTVTNEMVRAAGLSKTNMKDFAGSLSTIIPTASALGISFEEVGGAIATMTQHGETAQHATEMLRNLVTNLAGQNNVASQAMQQLGIDTVDLRKNLGKRGLSGTLEIVEDALSKSSKGGMVVVDAFKKSATATADLNTMLKNMSPQAANISKLFAKGGIDYKTYRKEMQQLGGASYIQSKQFASLYQASQGFSNALKTGNPQITTAADYLKKMLGGMTGMQTALQLGGSSAQGYADAVKSIGDAGKKSGKDISTWAKTSHTAAVQLDKLKAGAEVLGEKLGEKLLPFLLRVVGGLTHFVDDLNKGKKPATDLAKLIGGVAIALTAIWTALKLVNAALAITEGISFIAGLFTGYSEIMLIVAAVVAVGTALTLFFTKTKAGKEIWGNFTRFLGEAWQNFLNLLKGVGDFFRPIMGWIHDYLVVPIANFVNNVVIPGFKAIQDAYVAYVTPIFQGFADGFNAVIGFIQPVVDWIVQNALPIIQQTIKTVGDSVGTALVAIQDALGQVQEALQPFIDTWTQQIWPVLAPILGQIAKWIAIIGLTISALPLAGLVVAIGIIVAALVAGIIGIAKFVTFVANIASTIVRGFELVVSWMSDFQDKIKATWDGLPDWARNIGVAIMNGLINGLNSMVPGLGSTLDGIGNTIQNALSGYSKSIQSAKKAANDAKNELKAHPYQNDSIQQVNAAKHALAMSQAAAHTASANKAAKAAAAAAKKKADDAWKNAFKVPNFKMPSLNTSGTTPLPTDPASSAAAASKAAATARKAAAAKQKAEDAARKLAAWRDTVKSSLNVLKDGRDVAAIKRNVEALNKVIISGFKSKLISHNQEQTLLSLITKDNTKLLDLAKKRQAIADKITAANKMASDIRTGVVNAGTVTGGGRFVDIKRNLVMVLNQAKQFGTAFNQLKKLGLNKTSLNQIISQFVSSPADGLATAKAILAAGQGGVGQLNDLTSQIGAQAKSLGNNVADSMFDSGKQAGKGFLAGLKAQESELTREMDHLGKVMAKSIRAALGIHSPSKVMAQVAGHVMDGLIGNLSPMRAQAAMAKVAGGIVRGASLARPEIAIPLRPAAGGLGGGGQTINLHIHVGEGALVAGHPVEIGKKVGYYVNEALRAGALRFA